MRPSIVSTKKFWDVKDSGPGCNNQENPTGTDKLTRVSLKLSKSTSGTLTSGHGIQLYI